MAAADDHQPPVPGGAAEPRQPRQQQEQQPSSPPVGDPMGPPEEPCECWCMHCHRTFMSDGIWFQRVIGDPDGFEGFWMCPTPNCGGAGFTFDIFPTDPNHPANEGWRSSDDDDEHEFEGDDGELEDEGEEDAEFAEEWVEGDDDAVDAGEWDPDEAKYKALDEALGDPDDDDVEGEEWKHGLVPGERPPPRAPASWPEEERRQWEAEQRSYDEPDRRPRQLDWSNRPPRPRPKPGEVTEDDIPF